MKSLKIFTILFVIGLANTSYANNWCPQGQFIKSPISAKYSLCINYSEPSERVNKFIIKNYLDKSEKDLKEIYEEYILSDLKTVLIERNAIELTFSGQAKGLRYGTIKIIFDHRGDFKVIALPNR